jgi:hypothetical protein
VELPSAIKEKTSATLTSCWCHLSKRHIQRFVNVLQFHITTQKKGRCHLPNRYLFKRCSKSPKVSVRDEISPCLLGDVNNFVILRFPIHEGYAQIIQN